MSAGGRRDWIKVGRLVVNRRAFTVSNGLSIAPGYLWTIEAVWDSFVHFQGPDFEQVFRNTIGQFERDFYDAELSDEALDEWREALSRREYVSEGDP